LDAYTYKSAVLYGNLDVIKWLRVNGYFFI